jgi:hypothetical protein
MTTTLSTHRRVLPAILVLAAVLVLPAVAQAQQYAWFNGKLLGIFKSTITVGAAVRGGKADPQLVGAGAGQTGEFPGASGAVGVNDDPELNFRKGDLVSAPMSILSELTLRHRSGQGVFLRVRAWYDMALEAKDVSHGNVTGGYQTNTRLDDTNFLGAARFQGIDIYDAFFFGNYKISDTRLTLRVGRQALDWGEGLFYPGIAAVNPYDVAWMQMTGARPVNGGRLPVSRIYANVTGPAGFNFDGFYNLEFRGTNIAGCGTWYSLNDQGSQPGCNVASPAGLPDTVAILLKNKSYWNGKLFAAGLFPNGAPDTTFANAQREPSRWSGYGVSARKFVEPINTELGFYYTKYTNPTFNISPMVGTDALTFGTNTSFKEDVRAFAMSASTGVRNLVLSGQITRTLDFPAQRNSNAFIEGSLSGIGPYGYMKSHVNEQQPGFFLMNVTQAQFGGMWQLGRYLRLPDTLLIAEMDMQWATNHPGTDGPNAERLGRYGNFGAAAWNQQGYVCTPGPLSSGVINKCQIDGFATPFAAGYKVRLQTTTPQVGPGLTFKPVFTLGNDITGFSTDGAILGGRLSFAALLRIEHLQRTFVELGGTWYRHATFDPLADRSVYTIVYGVNLR